MATFQELQTRVLANIIDTPEYVQSRVADVVNEVVTTLQGGSHSFWVQQTLLETTTDVTNSPADLLEAAVPSNFKEWNGKPWLQPQFGRNRPLSVYATRRQVEDI